MDVSVPEMKTLNELISDELKKKLTKVSEELASI